MALDHLTPPLHRQHIGRGVTFAILGALCFSVMSFFAKVIGERASNDTVVFARFFISLILILPWVIKDPKKALRVHNLVGLIFRSLFTILAVIFFFYSLRFLPLSNAILLNNTFPLFVPIVAWLMGGHRTPRTVWMGILVGFIGVGLVLQPSSGFLEAASLIGLASGIFAAIGIMMIRRLTKTTPVLQILFYNFLFCSLAAGLALPFDWHRIDREIFIFLLAIGIFGAAYQFFSTIAYASAPARITSPLMFSCILFGALADWWLWHQMPNLITLSGMALVILGGLITIYFGQKELMKG